MGKDAKEAKDAKDGKKGKDAKDAKDATTESPKKGKKKLIIIIAAVVLALGGGGGGYLMFKPTAATAKPAPKPGLVVVLDAVTINLQETHFLKLKFALQLTASAAADIDGSKAMDLAIAEYSNRPMAELFSNGERNKTKAELLEKIEKAYDDEVMDIYFTSFVIQ
jgi:flagellar FliL protein